MQPPSGRETGIEYAVTRCIIIALIIGTWGSAGAATQDREPPSIVHEPCTTFDNTTAMTLWAQFYDASAIFEPKVVYRTGRDTQWRHVAFTRSSDSINFSAALTLQAGTQSVAYFIETFDEHGNGPTRFGSPDTPVTMQATANAPKCNQVPQPANAPMATTVASLTLPAAAPDALTQPSPQPAKGACQQANAPFYCSGWFWTAVGTVALGSIGVGTYYAIKPAAPTSTSPTVTLKIDSTSPSTALGTQ